MDQIKELNAKLNRYESSNFGYSSPPTQPPQTYQTQLTPAYNPQANGSDYSRNSNYRRNPEPTGEFQGFADPHQYGDEENEGIGDNDFGDEGAYSQEDVEKIEDEIEEEPEEEIIELTEEEKHRIYLDSLSNVEYLGYYTNLPGTLLRSEETREEFWLEVERRKLDTTEKHQYFQETLQIHPEYQSISEIETLISKFKLNEADLNIIFGKFKDQNQSLEFLDLIMESLIRLIFQKMAASQLKLEDSYRFSGATFTVGQFIHYPIKLYYDKMKMALSLKYIQLLKTNLVKTTEFSFKYELKIFLDLQRHIHLKSLIEQELVQKERQIEPSAIGDIWYLIFRVYYESQDLETFLQLPNILPEWKDIAEFELNNIRDSESIPSISKFKGVYGTVCHFFNNEIKNMYELVSLFVKEIEKTRKRARDRGGDSTYKANQFIHLYVPFFASYLHKLHQNTGSEEDYGVNLLSLCFKFSDMYKGFITIYEEMLEKYTLWAGSVKDVQDALDQIFLMRTAQNEEIPLSTTI